MRRIEFDIHGVHFVTDQGLPGFITRGALQDLNNLPYGHRWPDQEGAFAHHAAEIERFAHALDRNAMLHDGRAVILPQHVIMC